jgi:hypothetical protein
MLGASPTTLRANAISSTGSSTTTRRVPPLGFGTTSQLRGRLGRGAMDLLRRFIALLSFDPRRSIARR